MSFEPLTQLAQRLTAVVLLVTSLSACYEFGKDDPVAAGPTAAHEVSGSVGDGPITDAAVVVFAPNGRSLASGFSDANADYTLTVNAAPEDYPLTIRAEGGIDLVTGLAPDFQLLSAVLEPEGETVANLNPFTTVAYELASSSAGGLTAGNLNSALDVVVRELNFGLDTLVASGPMKTRIDANNVAELVKASETLGEAVRRTRDALGAVGRQWTGDEVVRAIAADLTDSVLDGDGGLRANARVAAVFSLTAAQVSLEAMTNQLRVNGAPATGLMDSAIATVLDQSPAPSTTTVRISGRMLNQTRVGLAAAQALLPANELAQLEAALSSVTAGMLPADASNLLPGTAMATLDNVILTAAGGGDSQLEAVNSVVRNDGAAPSANTPPSISGMPSMSVAEGAAYDFTPSASDADGDVLTFEISNRPAWASFSSATGRLFGTPQSGDAGAYGNIVISVSDGQASAALPTFSIIVEGVAGNSVPSISGTPATAVAEGSAYDFTPTASDGDGDALSFSITNQPVWASFDTSSGRLFGTPQQGDAGNYSGIVISVSDGQAMAALPAFSIRVDAVAVNAAPTISGTPPSSVAAGATYDFTPTANDPNGDALNFAIAGMPGWASFDTSNGRLFGTPDQGDAGTYSNIVISVTDGEAGAELPAFSITVTVPSTGSATLSWTAPTQNEDGTALTDLAGYRIYWGTTPGSYTDSVTVNNPGITTYVVDNLPSGTYEFVVTAFNTGGVESDASNSASKTVP